MRRLALRLLRWVVYTTLGVAAAFVLLFACLRFQQYLFRLRAERLYNDAMSIRMRRTLGVTGPQRLVLRLVGHYGQTTPGDLAGLLHVHPSSLTGVLRRLEHAKLIRRVADPGDRRRALLTLTERGRSLNCSGVQSKDGVSVQQ